MRYRRSSGTEYSTSPPLFRPLASRPIFAQSCRRRLDARIRQAVPVAQFSQASVTCQSERGFKCTRTRTRFTRTSFYQTARWLFSLVVTRLRLHAPELRRMGMGWDGMGAHGTSLKSTPLSPGFSVDRLLSINCNLFTLFAEMFLFFLFYFG